MLRCEPLDPLRFLESLLHLGSYHFKHGTLIVLNRLAVPSDREKPQAVSAQDLQSIE